MHFGVVLLKGSETQREMIQVGYLTRGRERERGKKRKRRGKKKENVQWREEAIGSAKFTFCVLMRSLRDSAFAKRYRSMTLLI